MSLKSFVKGWIGEAAGALTQKVLLDQKIYTSIHNVTLQTNNGTTQIDHVIVSKHGIFVVEAKNMDGWIFGDEKSPQWTQSLYGKKFRFQNPLHQNYRHTKVLEEFLGVAPEKLISIVMFWGECELKTELPPNVMTRGYIGFIKKQEAVVFSDSDVQQIIEALKVGMMSKGLIKSFHTHQTHLQSLAARHNSTTTCPKCGSELVLRTAKSGVNVGREFYGCSNFPKCRFIKPAHDKTSV